MRESDIETYFKKRVLAAGGMVRKVKFLDVNGAPDRLMLIPGSVRKVSVGAVWVELKRPGKGAKPHQAMEHAILRSFGQTVAVIDSIEGVDEIIGTYFRP